MKSLKYG